MGRQTYLLVSNRFRKSSQTARHPSPNARFARGCGWHATSRELVRRMPSVAAKAAEEGDCQLSTANASRLPAVSSCQPAGTEMLFRGDFGFDRGVTFARLADVSIESARFVYILRSSTDPSRRYIGLTGDIGARLHAHNAGQNSSTALWRPWVVDVSIEFRDATVARRFERYLKSGSGHTFARRHF